MGQTYNPWRRFKQVLVIPASLAARADLTHGAKLGFGLLIRFAGKDGHCWPSQANLARSLGVSYAQVRRYLDELAAAKLIRLKARPGTTPEYEFLDHPMLAADLGEPSGGLLTDEQGSTPRSAHARAGGLLTDEHPGLLIDEHRIESVEESHRIESLFPSPTNGDGRRVRASRKSSRKTTPDPRHQLFIAAFFRLYEEKHGIKPEVDRSDGEQLRVLLARQPELTVESWDRAVQNAFDSDDAYPLTSRRFRLRELIPHWQKYADSPLRNGPKPNKRAGMRDLVQELNA